MKRLNDHRTIWMLFGFVAAIVFVRIELANGATITVGQGGAYDADNIQAGIDVSMDGDVVLVAPGEYVITVPITFRGKAITVRSEAGPDEAIIRMGTPADPDRASVVVFRNNETAASVLEGFTITGGKGYWITEASALIGGGIQFRASSGTVRNCVIVKNGAGIAGGIHCELQSSPILINCIIAENTAELDGGGIHVARGASLTLKKCIITGNSSGYQAGGIGCWSNSTATLSDCIITENTAGRSGGGTMSWDYCTVTMNDCIVTDNTAESSVGGGMQFTNSLVTVNNCVVARNTADRGGGGVGCYGADSSLSIGSCTILGNSGGSSYGGGGVGCFSGCSVEVANSIIWGNTSPRVDQIAVTQGASTLTVTYSNIAGGQAKAHVDSGCTLNWGGGNIDANPLFAEPGYWADVNDPHVVVEPDDPNAIWIDGDYHLKSEVGRWDPYSESWVMDDVTSPCIDRGDPDSPVVNEPDPNGGRINMGAYGGTPEASMSIGQLPPLPPPIPLAHWKLDETEGDIAYDSAGVNDALVLGDPLWQPTGGQVDGALQLDGIDDYVSTSFVLNPEDGEFSMFAWIKGGAPGQAIISKTDSVNWLLADPSGGNLMTELKGSGRGSAVLLSQTSIVDGNWHRVGFVWDGSTRILYVDDVEVARDTQTNLESAEGGLYFGTGSTLASGSFFSGLIDDIRIYNRAISP